MQRSEIMHAIEAILFAAAEPVTQGEIRRVFERVFADESEEQRGALLAEVKSVFAELTARTVAAEDMGGFVLARVADGLTFRSNPRYSHVLRAMRDEKPQRLSQAALETLAIVAYRQPVTKPEVDEIRGVDSGGTMRLLLDRSLVRIIGKKDEPGRPMLYGTTREFLSFFNLGNLAQLPTLRDFHELTPESSDELKAYDEQQPSLQDLSQQAKKLRLDEEPSVVALDEAMTRLAATETTTKEVFRAQGVSIETAADEPVAERGASAEDGDKATSRSALDEEP